MAQRGPKRNKHQRARDRRRIASLRAKGLSLRAIARRVGLDEKQVRLDLAFIDDRLIDSAKVDLEQAKAQTVAKFRWAQIEAREAWIRSLEDAERTTIKDGAKNGLEETITTEGRSGNPGHLRNYAAAVDKEAELLGLYDLGSGKGDESAQRLLDLHELLQQMRATRTPKPDDTQNPPPSKS